MKGDFTRDTFDPKRHFQQVLQQQGRVQLDADWNEQAALTARRDATLTADVAGNCGGPAEAAAFALFGDPARLSGPDKEALTARFQPVPAAQRPLSLADFKLTNAGDFYLSRGRYYVDGIQCENEFAITYTAQPDRLDVPALTVGKSYLVYLDVWHRHLTALEEASLREPALGGPDTATRIKTVWQVRALELAAAPGPGACAAANADYDKLTAPSTARLSARTDLKTSDEDPCQVPETSGYKGLENQLYRVEVHEVDAAGAGKTWKWSRENGSVVVPLLKISQATKKLSVASLGRDAVLGFAVGQYVEILDDAVELEGRPGQLSEITEVSEAELTITLKDAPEPLATGAAFPDGVNTLRHPKVRRWEGTARIETGKWLPLEAGIQVRFEVAGARYRSGNFWLIPARAATADAEAGDIEWPREPKADGRPDPTKPLSLLPRGVRHHYCRLGFVTVNDATGAKDFVDCRCLWPALTDVPRLFYVSGDGQEVMPFNPADLAAVRFKLPQPLIAGVANPHCHERALKVRFEILDALASPNAVVTEAGAAPGGLRTVDVPLDLDGLARCDFHLDGAKTFQQVRARLLDANNQPVSLPLIFNANLSVAREVAYQPACDALRGPRTVQAALDRLARFPRMAAVGGDGQDGRAGEVLPSPLRIAVTSVCGGVEGFELSFTTQTGTLHRKPDGSDPGASQLDLSTDPDGLAECYWRLGSEPVQEVVVQPAGDPAKADVQEPRTLRFTANVRGGERNDPAPAHILGVQLGKPAGPLRNDARTTVADLQAGLAILCDQVLDPDTIRDPASANGGLIVRGQPTCFVTAEIPYPLTLSDARDMEELKLNADQIIGFRPLVLLGEVDVRNESPTGSSDARVRCQILWRPEPRVLEYLSRVVLRLTQWKPGLDAVLLRLTLKGNFIWSRDARDLFKQGTPGGFLDGETWRAPRSGAAPEGLLLPSGDDRRGGDFEMWFWVTTPRQAPVIVLQPAGQRVILGQALVLSAQAAGTPPLAYQWRFNGADIPGATEPTLSLPDMRADLLGKYSVVVTNTDGTATSEDAELELDDLPPLLTGGPFIRFSNRELKAVVLDTDAATPVGDNFAAQLFVGPHPSALAAEGQITTTIGSGLWRPIVVTLPTPWYGQTVYLQARVWDLQFGQSYEAAVAAGGRYGASNLLRLQVSPPSVPPQPATLLTGMKPITVEPGGH